MRAVIGPLPQQLQSIQSVVGGRVFESVGSTAFAFYKLNASFYILGIAFSSISITLRVLLLVLLSLFLKITMCKVNMRSKPAVLLGYRKSQVMSKSQKSLKVPC